MTTKAYFPVPLPRVDFTIDREPFSTNKDPDYADGGDYVMVADLRIRLKHLRDHAPCATAYMGAIEDVLSMLKES